MAFSKMIITNNTEETLELGKKLALSLPSGSVVTLNGELGAGKTTLVRGVARGLNINEVVQSPTFNIMKIYLKGNRPLIHIDAYRLADVNSDIGLDEYIGYETGLTFIEWSQYISQLIPKNHINIDIKCLDFEKRELIVSTNNEEILRLF
ncbi:MAG: tRNA (adenosine(37)-N6)-threonylcarbamoyltransferase complex ATPase subunit type 1 TsaE [Bacilli bacterium]|nr:tRNA (adenosine(37)-N6)-threonylcarbamoyltransferase complex ATPase subunit type 1 TsaE [Bacilli bacterium]